jgi:ABC-type branched-subunit amino acid transport system ATPase component
MSLLEVKNVISGYTKEIDIIRGVSFTLEKSEILCIIGPNGAGKSTLLKTIYGLVKAKSGQIIFDGRDITNSNPLSILKCGISYVPQARSLFPMMTVEENLEMGAYIRNDERIKDDIERVLELFPILKTKLNESAGNLSGGEQRILEMARALLLKPKILLLDEPTIGMAPNIAKFVFDHIKWLNVEQKIAIILVEQNAKGALSIADKAIVLDLGEKRFEGPAKQIMNDPKVKKLYLGLKE